MWLRWKYGWFCGMWYLYPFGCTAEISCLFLTKPCGVSEFSIHSVALCLYINWRTQCQSLQSLLHFKTFITISTKESPILKKDTDLNAACIWEDLGWATLRNIEKNTDRSRAISFLVICVKWHLKYFISWLIFLKKSSHFHINLMTFPNNLQTWLTFWRKENSTNQYTI